VLTDGWKTREVPNIVSPDGAEEIVPGFITNERIEETVAHLKSLPLRERIEAFRLMHRDPRNRFFLDIKQTPGPRQDYTSSVTGNRRQVPCYEATGNILYGYVGRAAGIPQVVIDMAAAYTDHTDDVWGDDPDDVPNVTAGYEAFRDSNRPWVEPSRFASAKGFRGAK